MMGLFDMCCPKKPKKSLDYVIKWIEDADKTFSNINASIAGINAAISALQGDVKDLEDWKTTVESNIDDLVAEAIEDYDWSQLPIDALQTKADKVENAVAGHFASLDANGNLVDSGKKTGDFVPYVSEGILGIKAEEYISLLSGDVDHQYVNIEIDGEEEQANPKFTINIEVPDAYPPISKSAIIDTNNIDNLIRALKDPSTTPENDNTKLITSGAVYQAIKDKFSLVKSSDNEIASLAVDVDEEGGTIELYITDGNGVAYQSTIDSSNIENLNRALIKPDSTPKNNSDKLITSGAVYTALQGINTDSISAASHGQASSVTTELGRLGEGPSVTIELTQSLQPVSAEINISNINNLIRALNTPYQGISGTEDNLVNGTYLLQVIGNTISNNTDVNNYIYLFKDDGQGGTQDYIVTGNTTTITSLNNFILNNTTNKLHTYYVLFASNEITTTELILGYARWIFWTNNADQSYWKVFLYVGDKTFTAKCTVADVVQETDVENYAANWSNWTRNEIA